MGLQVRNLWFFVAENRLQRPSIGLLQLFAVTVCVWIPPSARIALTVTARKPTEYCFIDAVWESGGNPEQPSIAVS